MSDTCASTIKMDWAVPQTASTSAPASRSLPTLAKAALVAAWALYIASLFLPAMNHLPGYMAVAASGIMVARLAMGDIAVILGAVAIIPNIAILLSPILLSPGLRRGRMMRVLLDATTTGATFALLAGLLFPIAAYFVWISGGTTSGLAKYHFGIGFYVWAASLFLLKGCMHLTRKSDGIVKK